MIQLFRYSLVCLILASCITGCGFRLRGAYPQIAHLHTIYLQFDTSDKDLAKKLQVALRNHGVTPVAASTQSPVNLRIINSNLAQTLTSTSSDMQVRNYLLTYTVQYQLIFNNAKVILAPQTITLTRAYASSTAQLLSGDYELNTLQQTMRQDAITQLLERLHSEQVARMLVQ